MAKERRMIAGVLWKRIDINMPLQVDATVTYAACGEQFRNCPPLTKNDLAIQSIFNTYIRRGLPPAPIANPGEGAIRAVQTPKASPYLYYLSDPETTATIFARTLEEHNANRARYLKR